MKNLKRPTKRWYLYIVRCCDGTLYTGITNNIERRIGQHNDGTASKYTRARVPVRLIYKEACRNKSSALKKELWTKDLSRKEKEDYIKKRLSRGAAETRRKSLRSI